MKAYNMRVKLSKQDDGLWRAQVPDLQGCWVDAPTIAEALSDILGVAAMIVDYYAELDEPLPESLQATSAEEFDAQVVLKIDEHIVKRPAKRRLSAKQPA